MSPQKKKGAKAKLQPTQNSKVEPSTPIKIGDLTCPSLNLLSVEELAMDGKLAPFYFLHSDKICVPEPGLVDVINVKTSQRVARFKNATSSSIIASGLVYSNPNQIFVACEDGVLCIWDYKTQKLVHEWNLSSRIHKVCTSPATPKRLTVLTSIQEQYEVLVIEMEATNSIAQEKIQEHPAYMQLKDQQLFLLGSILVSPSFYLETHQTIGSLGVVLAYPGENIKENIFFLDLFHFKSMPYYMSYISALPKAEVFAFHPTLSQFAIGASDAPIYLANLALHKNSKNRVVEMMQSKLHWHSAGPTSIRFSPDGLSLLSGGQEATLVVWRLDTFDKGFVPRLRSPISHIATAHDQSSYLIRFQDGSLLSIDPTTQRPSQAWAGATKSSQLSFKPSISPSSNLLCLPGRAGWIGLYNLQLGQLSEEFDPVKLNRVTDEETSPSVDAVSFSPEGKWAVIAVSIQTKIMQAEVHLQVWAQNPRGKHILVTEVWDSHPAPVVAIAFGKSESEFASLSQDGSLKLWSHSDDGSPHGTWICVFQTSQGYANPRDLCFSHDSSMLCITYAGKLALWDPQSLCLHQYLACPAAGDFACARFIRDTPFLAAVGTDRVVVFNLLSGSVWWSLPLFPRHGLLMTDDISRTFSVVGPQDILLTFDPSSPTPLFATRLPFTPTALVSLPFSKTNNTFLAVSPQMSIARLSSEQAKPKHAILSVVAVEDAAPEEPAQFRPLEIHQPLQQSKAKPATAISTMNVSLGEAFNRTLQIPSHVAPPVNQILGDFMLAMFAQSQLPASAISLTPSTNVPLPFDLLPEVHAVQPEPRSVEPLRFLPTPASLGDELTSLFSL